MSYSIGHLYCLVHVQAQQIQQSSSADQLTLIIEPTKFNNNNINDNNNNKNKHENKHKYKELALKSLMRSHKVPIGRGLQLLSRAQQLELAEGGWPSVCSN